MAFKRLAAELADINTSGRMQGLLMELLSESECRDLALRWQILELLAQGVSQREIAERLGVSLCKITRGSKILRSNGSAAAKILE